MRRSLIFATRSQSTCRLANGINFVWGVAASHSTAQSADRDAGGTFNWWCYAAKQSKFTLAVLSSAKQSIRIQFQFWFFNQVLFRIPPKCWLLVTRNAAIECKNIENCKILFLCQLHATRWRSPSSAQSFTLRQMQIDVLMRARHFPENNLYSFLVERG